MHIELNLASRPVENLRRFYTLAGTGVVLLALLAAAQATIFFRDWWGGREVSQQTELLRGEVLRLEAEQEKFEQQLEQPQVQEVMDRSYFLNALIFHKSISWTQILMDLEELVPDRVMVVSIRPEIVERSRVRLEMLVVGESTDQLLEFLRRIEGSAKFGTLVLSQEVPAPDAAQDPSIKLGLSVFYGQE